jgi:hypothetical protein
MVPTSACANLFSGHNVSKREPSGACKIAEAVGVGCNIHLFDGTLAVDMSGEAIAEVDAKFGSIRGMSSLSSDSSL